MSEFVANHVDGGRKSAKQNAVAIPKNHLSAVPKGIHVAFAKMHTCAQTSAIAIQTIASECVLQELQRGLQSIPGFINRGVIHRRLMGAAH